MKNKQDHKTISFELNIVLDADLSDMLISKHRTFTEKIMLNILNTLKSSEGLTQEEKANTINIRSTTYHITKKLNINKGIIE